MFDNTVNGIRPELIEEAADIRPTTDRTRYAKYAAVAAVLAIGIIGWALWPHNDAPISTAPHTPAAVSEPRIETTVSVPEETTTAPTTVSETEEISYLIPQPPQSSSNEILFSSDEVTVEICPPAAVPMICESIMEAQTREEFRQGIAAVADTVVKDVTEVRIVYGPKESPYTTYKTLYTVQILECYGNIPETDTIVVAVPDSSYEDMDDIPNFKVGDEALFFLRDTAALEKDPMDLKSYSGYYVMSPADIGVVKNDTVTVDSIISASPDEQVYANQSKVDLTFDDFRSKANDLLNK